jgi:hypothetical protein
LSLTAPEREALAIERDLLARAKRERAGLREVWEQATDEVPARRCARLAIELAKINPVLIQRNGTRVPCEPSFQLTRKERQQLAARMLGEGASRNEVLATVEISPSTLLKVARGITPNGGQKPHEQAEKNAASEEPAWVPPEDRGPAPIWLDATDLDPEQERRFRDVMSTDNSPPHFDGGILRRMTAEFERIRPEWHAWVYGAAKNPIHSARRRKG